MIGKCKAIAHGSTALDYIFREGKLGNRLAFHNLCSRESKAIYEEMKLVSDYNTRCKTNSCASKSALHHRTRRNYQFLNLPK